MQLRCTRQSRDTCSLRMDCVARGRLTSLRGRSSTWGGAAWRSDDFRRTRSSSCAPRGRASSSTMEWALGHRWKAKLVLLAHSEERASTLTEVITEWQEVNRSVPLVARALTMRHAAGDGADACLGSAAVL